MCVNVASKITHHITLRLSGIYMYNHPPVASCLVSYVCTHMEHLCHFRITTFEMTEFKSGNKNLVFKPFPNGTTKWRASAIHVSA